MNLARDKWTRFYAGADPGIAPAAAPLSPAPGTPIDPSTLLPPGFVIPGLTPGSLPQSVSSPGFMWDQRKGEALLSQLESATVTAPVTGSADDVRQVLMTVLVHAEQLAQKAGFAVMIPTDSTLPGQAFGSVIGGAYDRAKTMQTIEARAYVAAFDSVQEVLNHSQAVGAEVPSTLGSDFQSTIAPLVLVALVVVGIAALAAGAYVIASKIQIDSDSAERMARVDRAVALAMAGKPIPPGLIPDAPAPTKPGEGPGSGLAKAGESIGAGLVVVGVGIFIFAVVSAVRK